jgi:autotransporter-associated beta strand protein
MIFGDSTTPWLWSIVNHSLNLLGTAGARGVIETQEIAHERGTLTIDWSGGILRSTTDTSEFFPTIGSVRPTISLGSGGGFFDTNGNQVTTDKAFTGSGNFTKLGLGTLTLTGDHSYTGVTFVNEGILFVNGSVGDVVVTSNGTLGGTGTVGALALQDGLLSPGNSPGTLTAESFEWENGSIEFSLGVASDLLQVNGHFSGTGSSFFFTFLDEGWAIGATYDLIRFQTTSFTDTTPFAFTNSDLEGRFILDHDRLRFTVIPEPSSLGLLGLALLICCGYWHRRRLRHSQMHR